MTGKRWLISITAIVLIAAAVVVGLIWYHSGNDNDEVELDVTVINLSVACTNQPVAGAIVRIDKDLSKRTGMDGRANFSPNRVGALDIRVSTTDGAHSEQVFELSDGFTDLSVAIETKCR
jgi:hypothetical protein